MKKQFNEKLLSLKIEELVTETTYKVISQLVEEELDKQQKAWKLIHGDDSSMYDFVEYDTAWEDAKDIIAPKAIKLVQKWIQEMIESIEEENHEKRF